MIPKYYVGLFVAFLTTILFLRILIRLAPRLNLLDYPGGHRKHSLVTPLVGGLAMFCAFLITVLLANVPLSGLRLLFAGSTLLVIVGVLDDMHELSTKWRFIPQVIVAFMMTYWGANVLSDLGRPFSDELFTLGRWGVPLTIFATVGVINAFNMVDGLDGLAGCLFFVGFMVLAYIGWSVEFPYYQLLGFLTVIVLAFLLFNLPLSAKSRARTFMGDAGSMFLGFILCWFLIAMSQGPDRVVSPVAALWLVTIPLFDTVAVMIRRPLMGVSPFNADRTHLHHVLLALKLSKQAVLGIILLLSLLAASVTLFMPLLGWAESSMFYLFICLFAVYFVLTTFLVRKYQLTLDRESMEVTGERRRAVADRRMRDRRSIIGRRERDRT